MQSWNSMRFYEADIRSGQSKHSLEHSAAREWRLILYSVPLTHCHSVHSRSVASACGHLLTWFSFPVNNWVVFHHAHASNSTPFIDILLNAIGVKKKKILFTNDANPILHVSQRGNKGLVPLNLFYLEALRRVQRSHCDHHSPRSGATLVPAEPR